MKNFLIFCLITISGFAFGQDSNEWGFKFKFKINTTETIRYKYENLEVFINDSYTDEKLGEYELKFDPSSQEYTLQLNYGCVSCGYINSNLPPEIYLKINLENAHFGIPFSSIIPIYFQKSESFRNIESEKDNLILDLGTIDLEPFITANHWKIKTETFEIIEVTSKDSKYYRKSGEYTPRRMNRLIKIDLKKWRKYN